MRVCPLFLALFALACGGPAKRRAGVGDDTEAPLDSGAPPAGLRVERLSTPVCADPAARAAGPLRLWPTLTLLDDGVDDVPTNYGGSGVAAADLNGDGWIDLYLGSTGAHRLLLSRGPGVWTDTRSGLPSVVGNIVVGAIPGDYDGDGDTDLYVLVLHGSNALWQNDGAGRFTDVTAAAGLGSAAEDTVHAQWVDLDGDDDLDLLVANHWDGPHLVDFAASGVFLPAHPNRVYLNDGRGAFTDASGALPAAGRDGYSFVFMGIDLDDDGQHELYAVNDFGSFATPNTLLRWQDGAWVQSAAPAGLDLRLFGMSANVGDLNNDGRWDFAMSSWGELALVESDANGDYYRSDRSRGVVMGEEQATAWGSALEDLDNDGDLDLAVLMGPVSSDPEMADENASALGVVYRERQPDAIFVQGPDGLLRDVGPEWGFASRGQGRGLLAVDLDLDGWLDLVRRELDGPTAIYQGVCGVGGGLVISLRQGGANPEAVGAVLRVTVGDRVHQRRVHAGGEGMATGGPAVVHIGLGEAAGADAVEVRWPDGSVDRVSDSAALGPGAVRIWRGSAG